jgi:hypothetical protein
MEQAGKTIWERDLPGEKYAGAYEGEWRLLSRSQVPDESEYARNNPSGVFLFAETADDLEQGNSYRLPAGKHRLRYALNADTGEPAAVWVSNFDQSPHSTPAVVQTFDPKTGRLRREERFDFMKTGGLALGAKEESWLRKIVRTHDAQTGKLVKEETLRWTPGGVYVPVGGP